MSFHIPKSKRVELLAQGKYFITEVAHEIIDDITSWVMSNPTQTEFTLLINSSGGSAAAAARFAAFVSTLRKEVHVTGITFDTCGSAALALLQCCHTRITLEYCGFFIHHINPNIQINCQNYNLRLIEAELQESRKLEEALVRLQSKRCGMTQKKWNALADKGELIPSRAIYSREALQLGLVDKIIDRYEIF